MAILWLLLTVTILWPMALCFQYLRAKKADPVTGISLYSKLHRAKLSIGKVVKNATNPHFKKSYADINALLETVEPILPWAHDAILRYKEVCCRNSLCSECGRLPRRE